MRRRELLLLGATAGCQSTAPEPWHLGRAAAAIARAAGESAESDDPGLLDELASLAARARGLGVEGVDASTRLLRLLFDELGFSREVDSTDLSFVLLPGVLRQRRGSCVGLGTLYLALGEALGFTAHGVLMPGHFYVRHESPGAPRNVELLRRGEAMSDAWYQGRFPVPVGAGAYYGAALTTEQVLGVIEYNVGNERRRQQRPLEAEAAYARAVQRFPTFAEAHASLGALQHMLGQLPSAAASYRTARELNAHLSGLDANMALLDAERQATE